MKLKKLLYFLGLFIIFLTPTILAAQSSAQEKVEINFFYSKTCTHCAKEDIFLNNLIQKYSFLDIKKYDFSQEKSQILLKDYYHQYHVPIDVQGFVPITFIRDKYFLGFSDEETGPKIEEYILFLTGQNTDYQNNQNPDSYDVTPITDRVKIPILGEIDVSGFSLPALAVVLGFFDGFNVCSLGALVLILGIVLAFRSKRKTFILGIIFILTTAIIYGILIFIWHQMFTVFAIYLRKMELVIGILGIIGGIYFVREFFIARKKGAACEFGGITNKMAQRFQKKFYKTTSILALIGLVFAFAAIVTIIEFPCSAVLPVFFASILSNANLPSILAIIYIGVFIFFYLLDEIIVFLIAVFTMKIWVTSPKFVTWLNLIAAIMLLLLGSYYLFGLV